MREEIVEEGHGGGQGERMTERGGGLINRYPAREKGY